VNVRSLAGASAATMLGATTAFVVALFLDWHRTAVEIAGVTTVQVDEPGWNGWGWLAGSAAISLLALTFTRLMRGAELDPTFGIAPLVLGVVMLSATVAAVFAGSADVQVGTVGVVANEVLWPAWAGLALACVAACAAAVVALPAAWQPSRRPSPTAA
jgi:hypothetical protein